MPSKSNKLLNPLVSVLNILMVVELLLHILLSALATSTPSTLQMPLQLLLTELESSIRTISLVLLGFVSLYFYLKYVHTVSVTREL